MLFRMTASLKKSNGRTSPPTDYDSATNEACNKGQCNRIKDQINLGFLHSDLTMITTPLIHCDMSPDTMDTSQQRKTNNNNQAPALHICVTSLVFAFGRHSNAPCSLDAYRTSSTGKTTPKHVIIYNFQKNMKPFYTVLANPQ